MIIFPAIDIKDGKCVRLIRGDFDKITFYENSPIDQAKKYSQNGFNHIHIVDLDGALQGKQANSNIVKEIIKKIKLKIQIGGGIRTIDDINSWIKTGVDKIVMGTAAIEDIALHTGVKHLKKFYNGKGSGMFTKVKKGTPAHVKAAIIYNDLLKY